MKTVEEIKKVMETVRMQLTQETDEKGIALLQGQHAALDWVISVDEEKESTGGEQS